MLHQFLKPAFLGSFAIISNGFLYCIEAISLLVIEKFQHTAFKISCFTSLFPLKHVFWNFLFLTFAFTFEKKLFVQTRQETPYVVWGGRH